MQWGGREPGSLGKADWRSTTTGCGPHCEPRPCWSTSDKNTCTARTTNRSHRRVSRKADPLWEIRLRAQCLADRECMSGSFAAESKFRGAARFLRSERASAGARHSSRLGIPPSNATKLREQIYVFRHFEPSWNARCRCTTFACAEFHRDEVGDTAADRADSSKSRTASASWSIKSWIFSRNSEWLAVGDSRSIAFRVNRSQIRDCVRLLGSDRCLVSAFGVVALGAPDG